MVVKPWEWSVNRNLKHERLVWFHFNKVQAECKSLDSKEQFQYYCENCLLGRAPSFAWRLRIEIVNFPHAISLPATSREIRNYAPKNNANFNKAN